MTVAVGDVAVVLAELDRWLAEQVAESNERAAAFEARRWDNAAWAHDLRAAALNEVRDRLASTGTTTPQGEK